MSGWGGGGGWRGFTPDGKDGSAVDWANSFAMEVCRERFILLARLGSMGARTSTPEGWSDARERFLFFFLVAWRQGRGGVVGTNREKGM